MIQRNETWAAWLISVAIGGLVCCLGLPQGLAQSDNEESVILSVLQAENTPAEKKALACKNLAIVGSARSVPTLAKLLPDPQLNSWALIALEAIPGEEASTALREAAGQLTGLRLVGVINAIGVRRDAAAVETLGTLLEHEDAQVVAAAAMALGQIGNLASGVILRTSLKSTAASTRAAAAQAAVICAERLQQINQNAVAEALYDDIRQADVPQQRQLEAIRGAILLKAADGLPMLVELLHADKKRYQLALQVIRELPPERNLQAIVEQLSRVAEDRQATLLLALSDRIGRSFLPVLLTYAQSGSGDLQSAAIESIGQVGDESCLDVLVEIAQSSDERVANLATAALSVIPGQQTDRLLLQQLTTASGQKQVSLLRVVGARRIEAIDTIKSSALAENTAVRLAALYAAGETLPFAELAWLLELADAPSHRSEQAAIWQALKTACVRMPNRDECATLLSESVRRASAETSVQVLEILANIGGGVSLQALDQAARNDRPELADAATRLLGTWNGPEAAPVLLALAKELETEKLRVRVARGYVGLIRKFKVADDERVAMCQAALEVCRRPADQQLLIDVMKLYPSPAMLAFAESLQDRAGFEKLPAELRQLLEKKSGR